MARRLPESLLAEPVYQFPPADSGVPGIFFGRKPGERGGLISGGSLGSCDYIGAASTIPLTYMSYVVHQRQDGEESVVYPQFLAD